MSQQKIPLSGSWREQLGDEFSKPYFDQIRGFLRTEMAKGKKIYPPPAYIFNAFDFSPFDRTKVVIIGQDPYHGHGQAHGLSFSVRDGMRIPPSLQNMYKELHADLGLPIANTGNLEVWAKQGVLMLNAILTVNAGEAASHRNAGWEQFTDAVIKCLSDNRTGVIFLLWGRFAQNKAQLIDQSRHFVLTAAHPSPFSANNGFFGCKHFSKVNEILSSEGYKPIDWQVRGE